MYIKVSKKMVNELNKALKKRKKGGTYTSIYSFNYDYCDLRQYELNVDSDLFHALDYDDYDGITNTFKFIRIIYNENCYSFDRFITTYDLNRIFKSCDKTLDGFINEVFNTYEI